MNPPQNQQSIPRKRASKPKVRSGCITCKARRVKCDEGRPACTRCTKSGRQCQGYPQPQTYTSNVPKTLAPAPRVNSPEHRALEFFFHKTSSRLAGFLDDDFFQGSVKRFSLSEPAIRNVIAAIAIQHERSSEEAHDTTHVALYNRSIRAIIEKTQSDSNTIPVVAMANILFICYEYLQGNGATAAKHIQSGFQLLQSWREQNQNKSQYRGSKQLSHPLSSQETILLETEVAPLLLVLNILNTHSVESATGSHANIFLNEIDAHGSIIIPRFKTIQQARCSLIDLITITTSRFERLNTKPLALIPSASKPPTVSLKQWDISFNEIIRLQERFFNASQHKAVTTLRVLRVCITFAMATLNLARESEWDAHIHDFEECILLMESLLDIDSPQSPSYFSEDIFRILSLSIGCLFPLNAIAYKCRWPVLRRRALRVLRHMPSREWIFSPPSYHAIFLRIMELEEGLGGLNGEKESTVPDEEVRICDWRVGACLGGGIHTVTFWRAGEGGGCFMEDMVLELNGGTVPINMMRH